MPTKPKVKEANITIETIAASLDQNAALTAKIVAIADADDTRSMSKLDLFNMIGEVLSVDEIRALPIPGTQGWIKPVMGTDGKMLNHDAVHGVTKTGVDYPQGYESNNPEWMRRQTTRQGSTQMVPFSRLELFASKLAIIQAWEAKAVEQDALVEKNEITESESEASYWRGRASRMVSRIVDAIRLGHQLENAKLWEDKLTVSFHRRKEFIREKDGSFKRDAKGAAMFKMVDAATDKPIVITTKADGDTPSKVFYKTVEQFLALDFVGAMEKDGTQSPAGELATLWETVERETKPGKDTVSIGNALQGISALSGLAMFMPNNGADEMLAAIKKQGDLGHEMNTVRIVFNHLRGWLNRPELKAALEAFDKAEHAKADAEEKAKAAQAA